MYTTDANANRATGTTSQAFPAYGPIEALLGYVLFYVIVDRVTPDIVETFGETVLDLSPSFVRFGLAAALWFVLVVALIDQARRQLAALGLVSYEEYQLRLWSRVTPASVRTAGYLAGLLVGGGVAALTFGPAVETLRSLITIVATTDIAAFDVAGFLVMTAFFVAYGLATHSLDRLVIDVIRVLPSE
jgi:hypothetical protein